MLVEADDTVEVERVLWRREELLAHSWMSCCEPDWLMTGGGGSYRHSGSAVRVCVREKQGQISG